MNDGTTDAGELTSTPSEAPPGVAELMKLYEGMEDVYLLAEAASGSYEEQSATGSSTSFRLKAK